MNLRPGDSLEWELGDSNHNPNEWSKIKKHTKSSGDYAADNLSRIDKIKEETGMPQEVISHIKKYGADSLENQWTLASILHVPKEVASKRLKIGLIILAVAAGAWAIHGGYNALNKKDKIEKMDKKWFVDINLADLAWHGQTKITWFQWALVDATDEKIFRGNEMLSFEETFESSGRKVNYKQNLKELRQHKFRKNPNSKGMAAMSGVYNKMIVPLVNDKEHFTAYSLDQWSKDMDQSIINVNKHIDREKVCELTGVSNDHKDVLVSVFNRMKSEHVLSYTLTELFGDLPWEFSIYYLDYLFSNGWKEYVYHIPAVYDNMASFGPYQLTSSVVRHDNHKKWSANVMQEALPEKQQTIPWSMYLLTPQEQNEATYLNMIYNLAVLINHLERNKSLEKKVDGLKRENVETILQMLAVSHNSPLQAIRGAKQWLNNNKKKPYESYVSKGKRVYAERTTKFYKATQTYRNKR